MKNSEFTNLLEPHYNDAVNYCRALCAGKGLAEAEDIIQQSLLKAFEAHSRLNDPSKFRSWFFQIITRTFYDSVRKPFWSRFVSLNEQAGTEAFQVYEPSYFEDNQWLIGGLSQLSNKERTAILLFEIGGFSIQEITKLQQEKSESAVKSRLSRTRKKLKEFMEASSSETNGSPGTGPAQHSTKDLYHETSQVINESKSMG